MKHKFKKSVLLILPIILALNGCSSLSAGPDAEKEQTKMLLGINSQPAPETAPVVSVLHGAWLMGDQIKVEKPLPSVLMSQIMYHPAQRVSLSDVSAHIMLTKDIVIDTSEVTQTGNAAPLQPQQQPQTGMAPMPGMSLTSMSQMMLAGRAPVPQTMDSMLVNYEGTLSGLLDVVASKAKVWWRFDDGKVVFYKTETKTFYFPSISRQSTGANSMTSVSGGVSGSGGATYNDNFAVDVFGDMLKAAKVIGGDAKIAVDPSAGSLTVTGTPSQVRAISSWAKSLTTQMSQQVAITVHMYRVKITKEDTYNWSPSIIFKNAANTLGYAITAPGALLPTSGVTPFGVSAGVTALAGDTHLGAPLGAAWGQYSGSQAAFQALSTLGKVGEVFSQTLVTLNGLPVPIQVANQQGYLASSQTIEGGIGVPPMTTFTPGSITTGLTGVFIPRIINGKILLSMGLSNSVLIGITTLGTAQNGIQVTNQDLNTFQQSVSLMPGDALLLSGVQQDNTSLNNQGVGSATNAVLGGGIDNQIGKMMIAIVITAKVL